uniref:Uncharacterized protein n=1 Tax=Glossina palpalis gambiensis TaxID=67801 RepID=A0A1B0AZZ0_9MUSC
MLTKGQKAVLNDIIANQSSVRMIPIIATKWLNFTTSHTINFHPTNEPHGCPKSTIDNDELAVNVESDPPKSALEFDKRFIRKSI